MNGLPENWTKGHDVRVIKLLPEDCGWSCGGTHVNHINEIGIVKVTKIKVKGKNTQVEYQV